MGGLRTPSKLVPVPPEVQEGIRMLVSAHGKLRTIAALACSDPIMEDALAPGARLRPATLARLKENLGAAAEKLKEPRP